MNDRELEAGLRALYRAEVSEVETAPLTLRRDVAAIPWTVALRGRRFGHGRGITLLAAAALLLAGGALAAGSGMLRLPSVTPPAPGPSFAVVATRSPVASASPVTIASPRAKSSPTPTASASGAPSPTPAGLNLTWTKVALDENSPCLAWVGDRFVLADLQSRSVRTSTDGVDWQAVEASDLASAYVDTLRGSIASWQDAAVGWWNPQDHGGDVAGAPPITARDVVQVIHPPAAPTSTTPFKGRIGSIGIGPKGIVAEVHSALDWDGWVTKKLGLRTNNDWVTHLKSVTYQNGVLQIKLNNRPGLKVVWADQGFEAGDYQDGGFGWYSPDGEHWTEMAPNDEATSNLPTGAFGQVVGVANGFIATGAYPDAACSDPNGCGVGMWFSADGLAWRFLGTESGTDLVAWMGGALVNDGSGHFDFWTSDGSHRLPVPADLHGTVGMGPLGLVAVAIDDKKAFVSRNGVDFGVSPIPAQMIDANRGWTVVVGDRTVLVLQTKGAHQDQPTTPSLWLGTFEP